MKKFIFLFFLLLVGFFPYFASTPFGKPFFIKLLEARLHGSITIQEISLSWFGPQRFENGSFSNQDLTATFTHFSSKVPFWQMSQLGDSFEIQDGSLSFPTYEGEQITKIQAMVKGKNIQATGSTPQGGSLSCQGTALSKQDFDLTLNLKEIPTIAIDKFFKFNGLLYKSLGSTINFNGSLAFKEAQGTLVFDLSSPQGKSSLNASIENDILTLNKPFFASLRLSDELCEEIVEKHISPKLITSLQVKNPVTLNVLPQGFSCSIKRPFSLESCQVGAAILDLGQIRVTNGKSLHSLVKIFKNKEFGKTMDIWFTSVALTMQDGEMDVGRMDALLSQSIHICTWGTIDWKHNSLRMILGLPGDTLEQSFGLQNLSRNYVLKIPVRGSIDNPDFETGPAIAKIATMAASQQIPTTGGKIFGGIVNVLTQAQDNGDAPPPNRPFPWEK